MFAYYLSAYWHRMVFRAPSSFEIRFLLLQFDIKIPLGWTFNAFERRVFCTVPIRAGYTRIFWHPFAFLAGVSRSFYVRVLGAPKKALFWVKHMACLPLQWMGGRLHRRIRLIAAVR